MIYDIAVLESIENNNHKHLPFIQKYGCIALEYSKHEYYLGALYYDRTGKPFELTEQHRCLGELYAKTIPN